MTLCELRELFTRERIAAHRVNHAVRILTETHAFYEGSESPFDRLNVVWCVSNGLIFLEVWRKRLSAVAETMELSVPFPRLEEIKKAANEARIEDMRVTEEILCCVERMPPMKNDPLLVAFFALHGRLMNASRLIGAEVGKSAEMIVQSERAERMFRGRTGPL